MEHIKKLRKLAKDNPDFATVLEETFPEIKKKEKLYYTRQLFIAKEYPGLLLELLITSNKAIIGNFFERKFLNFSLKIETTSRSINGLQFIKLLNLYNITEVKLFTPKYVKKLYKKTFK